MILQLTLMATAIGYVALRSQLDYYFLFWHGTLPCLKEHQTLEVIF